ncbi:MAG: hypothetical protein IPM17_13845 [Verrucomicrobia bacterium]|nr:hypothetical protein [Verrucomicrobiota bacterium]
MPKTSYALFGCRLGNRQGSEPRRHIPAAVRHARGLTPPFVKNSSGAGGKSIEVTINRRFKRQGRSWHSGRFDRLLVPEELPASPTA